MYIIIKKDKAEKVEEKLHKIKCFAEEVMDCFAEAAEERYSKEDVERDMTRSRRGRYMARDDEEDWEDEDYRDMARGRGSRGRGRGRY